MSANLKSENQELEQEDFEFSKIISHLKRHFQILKTGSTIERKESMSSIESFINEYKLDLESDEFQTILLQFSKNILTSFSDPSDKIRETSIKIMKTILSRIDNPEKHLKYIYSILISRTNCHDLEGIEGLPEQMIPNPSQKPQLMKDVVETSETARMELLELTSCLIECLNEQEMREFIQDTVNLVRVFLMDPFDKIQIRACKVCSLFVSRFKNLLYHFTVVLSRGLLLPLVSKKTSVKIAGLQALYDVLFCGTWKYTVDVFDILVGFRDPNFVAIKDFYENDFRLNYFALFVNSRNVVVREAFLRVMGDLLLGLPDRADIKGRVFPYILSGLFDEHESIQESCLEIMEEIGLMEEREKEEEFREAKQMGYDSEWTYKGKITKLPLPKPFKLRPRLGSRNTLKNELSKIIPPIRRELKDGINLESRYKATRLLQVLLVYSEEYIVEYLDKLIPSMLKLYSTPSNEPFTPETKRTLNSCFRLIGRFCTFQSFNSLFEKYLNFEIIDNEENFINALIGFKNVIEGYLEALPENEGMLDKKENVVALIEKFGTEEWLGSLGRYSLPEYSNFILALFGFVLSKGSEEEVKFFFIFLQVEEVFYKRSEKIARISLSLLSIPIFNLYDNENNKLNMRLIKDCITKTYFFLLKFFKKFVKK